MPTYVYAGCDCGPFETFERMADNGLTDCPTCSQPVHRVPQAPRFAIKKQSTLSTDDVAKQWYGDKLGRKVEKDEEFYAVPTNHELVPLKGLTDRQAREAVADAHVRAGDTDVTPDKVEFTN